MSDATVEVRCVRPGVERHAKTYWRIAGVMEHWVCGLCFPCPHPAQFQEYNEQGQLVTRVIEHFRRRPGVKRERKPEPDLLPEGAEEHLIGVSREADPPY